MEEHFNNSENDGLGVGAGMSTDFTEALSLKDWETCSRFSNSSFFFIFRLVEFD